MRSPFKIRAAAAAAAPLLLALVFVLGAACRDRDPNTPIALIGTPTITGGRAVPITYVLRNPDTVVVQILADFSADGGLNFRTATAAPNGEGTTNLTASPGGTTHVFLWDSLADLGPGRHEGMAFRVTPSIFQDAGEIAVTFPFTVDNTDLFVRVPDLALARQRSAAAALPESGAIVAGGGGLTATTEAFEPVTETISTRDALNELREGARGTTVLVADGAFLEPQPLAIGGIGTAGTLSSVERYDSGANDWQLAAATVDARVGHTATRLLDNRVLVAGGGPVNDRVIGDLGSAAAAIPGGADRTGHSATLLPDGRVLIAGGTRGATLLGDTIVFSPATGTYSPGPALQRARTGHAAAVVGGRVLVTGGRTNLAAGAASVTSSAEIADAALTAFEVVVNPMTRPRENHAAASVGENAALLVGGSDDRGRDLESAERFALSTLTFVATRSGLDVARSGHDATPIGAGRVLISGGGTDAVEVYYPPAIVGFQSFEPIASASGGRAEHEVTALADGRALVTGGTDGIVAGGQPTALASAEIFDPAQAASRELGPAGAATLTTARRRHTATLLADGTVLIAGGVGAAGTPLTALELCNPGTPVPPNIPNPVPPPVPASFTALAEAFPAGISEHTATRLADGRVLLAGGRLASGAASSAAFLFDRTLAPGSRLTQVAAPLAVPRRRHTATLLPDGRVLFAGGITGAAPGTATPSAEVFDPAGATFTATTGDLGLARFDHAAPRLEDGTVLVAGGRDGNEVLATAPLADVRRLDLTTLTFTAIAAMRSPRADFVAISVPGAQAVFAGGASAAPPATGPDDANAPLTASVEIYFPAGATSTATLDPDLAAPRRGMRAATLTNGTSILIGGRREAGVTVGGGERFTP